MIKLKNLLTETIYGNQAIVYHRTKVEDLANKIYDSGFKPSTGDTYGEGMYSTYELASQERPAMRDNYGDVIVEFAVNLTGFMFFDWSEFVKTALYKEKLKSSTSDTFIQDQITYYKISMKKPFEQRKTNFTSDQAYFVYTNSDLIKKVAGIVFTGSRDGKVLVCYDLKRLRPVAVKKDVDKVFSKINTTKDFLRKTAVPVNYNPNSKLVRRNSNGTFDILGDFGKSELEKYSRVFHLINVIEGDLDLKDQYQYSLPDLSKSTVKGDVDLQYGKLTSLEGSPIKVEGNFDCSGNRLTSLKGAPKSVGGNFDCYGNKLTTLEGAPKSVNKNFYCDNNKLNSLKGSPINVDESFRCNNNQLTSLEGISKWVGKDIICINNQLTTLKGAPRVINGNFDCRNNKLTSLQGSPEKIAGYFNCSENPLTSLEGCPREVGGNFIHSSEFTEDEILAVCNVKGQIIKL
jgi:hypothetical protein